MQVTTETGIAKLGRFLMGSGLALLGYEVGCPAHYRGAAALDESAARDSACPQCDHVGLTVVHSRRGASVTALCCCPACGHTEEF